MEKWSLFTRIRSEWIEKNGEEEGYRIICWEMNSACEGKKLIDREKKRMEFNRNIDCSLLNIL